MPRGVLFLVGFEPAVSDELARNPRLSKIAEIIKTDDLEGGVPAISPVDLEFAAIGPGLESPIMAAEQIHSVAPLARIALIAPPSEIDRWRSAASSSLILRGTLECIPESDDVALALEDHLADARRQRRAAAMAAFAEATLGRRARDYTDAVIDHLWKHIPVGIIITDEAGVIRLWSGRAPALFDRDERSALGQPLTSFFRARYSEEVKKLMDEHQPPSKPTAVEILSDSGRPTFVELTSAAVQGLGKDMNLVIVQDVTASVRAEAKLTAFVADLEARMDERTRRLVEANRALEEARSRAESGSEAKARFIANMSHELRTPLNAIVGCCDILSTLELEEDAVHLVKTMRESGGHLLGILTDILDFSQIEAGRLEIAAEPVDVIDVLERSLDFVRLECEAKGLDLGLVVAPTTPLTLIGDATRLQQIVVNFLTNAARFTDDGWIELAVRASPVDGASGRATWTISVRDTGCGIPADKLESIFEPFTQVETGPTRAHGGTGLGLGIANRIARACGGTLSATSTPGEGSTFELRLEAPCGESKALADLTLEDLRVLVAVREGPTRRSITRHAQDLGVHVIPCEPTAAAIKEAARGRPSFDAAVLDPGRTSVARASTRDAITALRECAIPIVRVGEKEQGPTTPFPVKRDELQRALQNVMGLSTTLEKDDSSAELRESARPLRILLAEDNPTNQDIARIMLTRLGHHPTVVSDGAEAVETVREHAFDIILMDVHMPVVDGLEATRRIRRLAPRDARPVIIAITANASPANRAECLEAGMDDHLVKPVSLRNLREMLNAWSRSGVDAPLTENDPRARSERVDASDRLDPVTLANLSRDLGGDEAVSTILGTFLRDVPMLLERMRAGAALEDVHELGLPAHTLKSLGRLVGARDLERAAADLHEKFTARADMDEILSALASVEDAARTATRAAEDARTKLGDAQSTARGPTP